MGTIVAPVYANLTMGYLEIKLYELCQQICPDLKIYIEENFKRYLDDCIIILDTGLIKEEQFFNMLNSLNSDIVFTKDVSTEKINFLDLTLYVSNSNSITTDIYYKPTNNFSYLPFNSNHSRLIKRNVPYCLMNRIDRLVSNNDRKLFRLIEMGKHLIKSFYPVGLVIDSILKTICPVKNSKTSPKNPNKVFYVNYNLKAYNDIYNNVIKPNIKILEEDQNFKYLEFQKINKQPLNIYNYLRINTKFQVKKCGKPKCLTCPILIEYKYSINISGINVILNKSSYCNSKNVVYVIKCNCNKLYIGKTTNQLNTRINLHRNQTKHEKYTILPANRHMRECDSRYEVTILYQSDEESKLYLENMEYYFIQLLKPELNTLS